ncbi:MAG: hypothetical protein [Arizlama microvirus]|nr:MAG: hypothetical protein [Arizlama microvirus]
MKSKQLKEETPTRPEHLAKRVKTNYHYLTPDGAERPDPTPMAPPIGYKPSDPLHKKIRQMIISEKLAMEAREANLETLDEADDFDVGDDYDPSSPYEEHFDPIGYDPGAARQAVSEHQAAVQARNAPRGSAEPVATQAAPQASPPSTQQPTGAAGTEGGATGVHPAAPPTPPPQATPTPRSPFWPRNR